MTPCLLITSAYSSHLEVKGVFFFSVSQFIKGIVGVFFGNTLICFLAESSIGPAKKLSKHATPAQNQNLLCSALTFTWMRQARYNVLIGGLFKGAGMCCWCMCVCVCNFSFIAPLIELLRRHVLLKSLHSHVLHCKCTL